MEREKDRERGLTCGPMSEVHINTKSLCRTKQFNTGYPVLVPSVPNGKLV